jgi:hypothetical protein
MYLENHFHSIHYIYKNWIIEKQDIIAIFFSIFELILECILENFKFGYYAD